uniref:Uncharacterized protein n=1 Tax=Eiseniibacteriota bacterium TaxID=2212470 RepID=A0A832ICJ2_UNCEI
MKKLLLLCGAMVALSATVASAAGLNLSWNDCGTNGQTARTFACNTNAGNNDMYASVIPPGTVPRFVGIDVVMDLQFSTGNVPAWWDLRGSGGCRNTSLTMSSDMSASSSGGLACEDFFLGGGGGGIGAYFVGFGAPDRARIVAFWAVPEEGTLNPVETYMFRMRVNNARTVGTGACAGCLDGACIVLNSINLARPAGVGDFFIANPANANFVTFNGGTPGCPGTVPAKNKTWGQMKSLYR